MERVRELVGFGADERRCGDVDRTVQLILAHAAIDLGYMLAQQGEQRRHKRTAAARSVLEEAALALVNAKRGTALQARVRVRGVDAQLIGRVPRFVDDGVHVGEQVVLVNVGGYAGVAHGEALREGVFGEGEAGVREIEAHELHEVEGHRALDGVGDVCGEERRVGLLAAFADGMYERDDGFAHSLEESVVGGSVHAAFVLVEPHVVGVARGVHVAGVALEGLDDAVHVGLEALPVVGALRLVPDGVGLAGEAAPRLDFLGGQGDGFALVAGERAHRVAACGRSVLGRDGCAVELGDLHEVLAGPELGLERAKARGQFFCSCHGASLR